MPYYEVSVQETTDLLAKYIIRARSEEAAINILRRDNNGPQIVQKTLDEKQTPKVHVHRVSYPVKVNKQKGW